jgi:hypothetical protein
LKASHPQPNISCVLGPRGTLGRVRRAMSVIKKRTGTHENTIRDRTALAHVDEAHTIRKPFVEDELAAKVRLALADPTHTKVVRLRG